jgi:uncharacterized protein
MAQTNQERIGKAMELLQHGLQPFVERALRDAYGEGWKQKLRAYSSETRHAGEERLDVAALLAVLQSEWRGLFSAQLGRSHRSLVHELTDMRNRWAHQETFMPTGRSTR